MLLEKIDVAVNAPESGTIKEFLAKEEDTVTVGQDIVKMELGSAPASGKKEQGGSEPKAPASDEQSTTSDPQPKKDENKKEAVSPPPPPKKEPQQEPESPKKEPTPELKPSPSSEQLSATAPKSQESKRSESKANGAAPPGNREERKACLKL